MYLWDDDRTSDRFGLPLVSDGEYQPGYDPPTHTPCTACPKIPEDQKELEMLGKRGPLTSADAMEPEEFHYDVVDHFLKCEAVRRFPRDFWTREHAFIIRPIMEAAKQAEQNSTMLDMLLVSLMRAKMRRPADGDPG